jgi:hypothetical protein
MDAAEAAWRVWNETGDSAQAEAAKAAALKIHSPPPEPAQERIPASDKVNVCDHLAWVMIIAKQVARKHMIDGEAEFEDIAGDATVVLVTKHPQFTVPPGTTDYDGAFRGWLYLSIKKECERSAERLLNAGTYKCRRQIPGQPLVVAIPNSLRTTASGEQIEDAAKKDMDAREPWQRHRALNGTLLRRCA